MRDLRRNLPWVPSLIVAPAAVGLFVMVLWPAREYWAADAGWAWWMWLTTMRYVGPLFAAVAAWPVAERIRDGRGPWLATTASAARHLVVAMVPPLVVGLCVTVGAAVAVRWVTGPVVGTARWALGASASAVATLVACVAVGSIVGRLWPHRLVAPVVGIATFSLTLGVANPLGLGNWIAVGGPVASLAGYEPDPRSAMARLAVAAGLVVLGVLLLTARPWAVLSSARRITVVLVAVATLTVAYVPGTMRAGADYVPDVAAKADTCETVDGVTACVLPENQRYAQPMADALAAVTSSAAELGVNLPGTYTQYTPVDMAAIWDGAGGWTPGSVVVEYGVGWIDPQSVVFQAVTSVFMPPVCNMVDPRGATDRMLDATPIVTRWLAQSAGASGTQFGSVKDLSQDPAVIAFDRLERASQNEYLRSTLVALQGCRFDDLPSL